MTGKEAILAAIDLQESERVPAAYFGGGMWTFEQVGETLQNVSENPERMAEVIVQVAEEINNPIVYCGSGYNALLAAALGGTLKYRLHGSPGMVEPPLKDLADLGTLDPTRLAEQETIQTIWKATEIVAKRLGGRFMVTATAWGPFTLASLIYGMEPLMRATFKAKDRVHELVELSAELILRFYEPLIAEGIIEMVAISDSAASGSLISRRLFNEFALPQLRKFTEKMRRMRVKTLLHICGDTNDRLDLLSETGADIISVDNKVDLAKAREAVRGKMCLGGNLSPVSLLLYGTPEMVFEEGRKLIEALGRGGGFMLMPGCDIASNVPKENVKALLQAAAATPLA